MVVSALLAGAPQRGKAAARLRPKRRKFQPFPASRLFSYASLFFPLGKSPRVRSRIRRHGARVARRSMKNASRGASVELACPQAGHAQV
jgi:hypothetical protein